ncbi:Ribosomal protein L9 [Niveomyces insectorum RCEF 264]|uniref:Ribosomal protein L9 n=1 Tax=Niveomyces insectorum RCEF 264 TaxID=1081102 RepID=A0A167M131_9HYPO|nr:Ribosomal protein L9 [Niveomyces insectorum RCEF 264]
MASPLLSIRQPFTAAPSCLGCMVRRSLAAHGGRPAAVAAVAGALNPVAFQTRGKKTDRSRKQGVIVRLLKDIPQYGRKDTIIRSERGRMRNLWYPRGMAEYMTTARFEALGLSPAEAVTKRDPWFGLGGNPVDDEVDEASTRPAVTLRTINAPRAAALLDTLLPPIFAFYRKPITSSADNTAIFGSVSADDVVATVRAVLHAAAARADNKDAALVRVEPRDVRFVVPADAESSGNVAADRVKALGRWEVEIAARGTGAAAPTPVRRHVDVLAESSGEN